MLPLVCGFGPERRPAPVGRVWACGWRSSAPADARLSPAAVAVAMRSARPALPSAWPATRRRTCGGPSCAPALRQAVGKAERWLNSAAPRPFGAQPACSALAECFGLEHQFALSAPASLLLVLTGQQPDALSTPPGQLKPPLTGNGTEVSPLCSFPTVNGNSFLTFFNDTVTFTLAVEDKIHKYILKSTLSSFHAWF